VLFVYGDFDVAIQTAVLTMRGVQIRGAFALSFTQSITAPVYEAFPFVIAYCLAVLTFTVLDACYIRGQEIQ